MQNKCVCHKMSKRYYSILRFIYSNLRQNKDVKTNCDISIDQPTITYNPWLAIGYLQYTHAHTFSFKYHLATFGPVQLSSFMGRYEFYLHWKGVAHMKGDGTFFLHANVECT